MFNRLFANCIIYQELTGAASLVFTTPKQAVKACENLDFHITANTINTLFKRFQARIEEKVRTSSLSIALINNDSAWYWRNYFFSFSGSVPCVTGKSLCALEVSSGNFQEFPWENCCCAFISGAFVNCARPSHKCWIWPRILLVMSMPCSDIIVEGTYKIGLLFHLGGVCMWWNVTRVSSSTAVKWVSNQSCHVASSF